MGRSGEDGGLGALRLSEVPSPSDKPRRILWQRPEPWNVSLWAKTSMDLFVEPELELWLQDDLSPDDSGAGIVLREIGDLPDRNAVETLIAAVPWFLDELDDLDFNLRFDPQKAAEIGRAHV